MPQLQQLTLARDIQEEEIRMSINLLSAEDTGEKLWRILRSHKDQLFTLKTLCVNSKIEWLQKIKTISFIKLTVRTVKQSTLVNLNGL